LLQSQHIFSCLFDVGVSIRTRTFGRADIRICPNIKHLYSMPAALTASVAALLLLLLLLLIKSDDRRRVFQYNARLSSDARISYSCQSAIFP